ncbi:hypothetical protein [Kribbella speibonae]|nr:hypothetical protein [Kribbella speibonae]
MTSDSNSTEKKGQNRGHINGKPNNPQPRPRKDKTSPHGDGKPNHNRGQR